MPMTFFNWSPNGGSIMECRMAIARVDNPNEIFDISWTEFSEMLQNERRMGYGGFAQPIPLPPKSSLTKTILFLWPPSDNNKLPVNPGRYVLNVLVWTKSSAKPSIIESFEFSISDQIANAYNFYLNNKNPSTVDISIRDIHRSNDVLTKSQAKEIYGL
jgi:hypothetical protein